MGSGLRKAVAAAFLRAARRLGIRQRAPVVRVSERTVRIAGRVYEPTKTGRLRELTPKEANRRARISETVKRQYAAGDRRKVTRTAIVMVQPSAEERARRRKASEPDYPELVDFAPGGLLTRKQFLKAIKEHREAWERTHGTTAYHRLVSSSWSDEDGNGDTVVEEGMEGWA